MTADDTLASLTRQMQAMAERLRTLEDEQAIRKLQHKYGYYMDKCLFEDVANLFAEDCELRFMGAIFRGMASVRRLYCGRFRNRFSNGKDGPPYGFLLDVLQLQDIVDVAPDGLTAQARFRVLLQGGTHESAPDPQPGLPTQWWEAGVYENTYVKENGIWKIKILYHTLTWQAEFNAGWRHWPKLDGPFFHKLYPEDPWGPDALDPAAAKYWPDTAVIPFHYPHPVTGR
jgi:hypothetical protein